MAYPSPAACAPLVALVLVLAPDARADFGPARVLVSSQNDYRDVAVADLDLDGDLDVLSASRLANEVAWFENLGGGALGPKQVLSSAVAGAASVFPADVDGDGDVDVLAAAPLADEVVWLENLGGGAFAFGGAVTDATPGAASVHAADLDGDGDLDVLVASPDDGGVGWVVNRGGGSFGPRRALATGLVDARSVTAADLDGDGDAEALVASRDALTWFENTGGAFRPGRALTTAIAGGREVVAADLDGDGDPDVLAASADDDTVAWYENLGAGSFGPQRAIETISLEKHAVCAADLDGDGDLDVAVASAQSFNEYARLAWYENSGAGDFGPPRTLTAVDPRLRAVAAADLSGDGVPEVLSASRTRVAWFENVGRGAFGAPVPVSDFYTETVQAVDLDGDGDDDALRSHGPYGRVVWNDNDAGTLGADQVLPGLGYYSVGVTAGDFDGDGDREVAWVDGHQGLLLHENLGGSFGPEQVLWPQAIMLGVLACTDMDGDGDVDLVARPGNGLAWFENVGGVLSTVHGLASDARTSVEPADLDGDGDLDLLTGDAAAVTWLENLGLGSFGPAQPILGALGRARAADLDGDGHADVLTAWDRDVAWYRNEGAAFGPRRELDVAPHSSRDAAAADLDGDGDLDVVVSGGWDGRVTWCENLGAGVFAEERVVSAEGWGKNGLALTDVDGDGRTDVLIGGAEGLAWSPPSPASALHCSPAVPNSSGASGSLRVYGSEIVADDALRLVAAALPPEPNVGYFVMGPGTSVVTPPGSAGPLCVGPGVLRFPGVHDTSEADGGFAQEVGTRGPVSGAITPGSTWGFQAWHRDQAAGSSNLTDAARVTFR